MLIRKCMIFILCCFIMSGCSRAGQAEAIFYDTDGHALTLSSLKGKWVVINYWAAWCSICIQEIPELNRFNQAIQHSNILFYGVDYDDLTLENLKSSISSVDIQYPVLTADPGEAWRLDEVSAIPTTFILNPEGQVMKVITGPNTARSLLNTISTLQTVSANAK